MLNAMLSAWSLPHHQPLHSNLLRMDTWLGFPHLTFSLCTENDFEKKSGMNWKVTAKTVLVQIHHKIQTFEHASTKKWF